MNQSAEVQNRIAQLRAKVLDNTLTLDDMKEAIKLLRAGRVAAQSSAAKSRTKKPPVDTEALFNELDAL